jgi:translocation and assembly module TamB
VDSLAAVKRARPISAQIRLTLGDSVTFQGFNVNAQFGGSLTATQRAGGLATATGSLTIREGHYKAYGQDLTIKDGVIRWAGGPVDNPGLSVRVTRTADTVVAGLQIDGTLKEPRVSVFSEPTMSEGQALSYLVTGHPAGEGAGASGNLATKALTSLGLRGGDFLAKAVGEGVGLSEARIQATGDFRSAAFVAGRYLSPNLYVSYAVGLFDPVSTLRLRYVLSNRFTLQAEAGKETGADVLIKVEPKPKK